MEVSTSNSVVNSSNTFTRHYKVGFYFSGPSYFRYWQNKLFLSWNWVLSHHTFVHSAHRLLGVFWFFCLFVFALLSGFNICFILKEVNGKIALLLIFFYSFVAVQSLNRVWLFVAPWTATCQSSLSFLGLAPLLKTTDPNLSPSQSTHLEITPHNCVTKHEFIFILVKIFYSARRATRKKGIEESWIFLSVKTQQSHHKTDKKRAELRIRCFWLNLIQWGFINEKSQCK